VYAGPAFGRKDLLLPIGPRAEGGPVLHLRELTLSIEAVCVGYRRGDHRQQYF